MSLRALAPSNPCALRPAIRTDATAKHLIGRKCSSVTNSRRAWCDLQRPSVRQNDRHVLAFDVAGFVEAFARLAQKPIDALLVGPGSLFDNRRVQLATLAAYHRVPAIYPQREAAEAGGLMSYGTSLSDAYRQAGVYTGRVLKGEKPVDLPVIQSIKFDFVINLNTANAFGLSFPPGLLAIADEVIE